ncbi:hypothetical protein L288_18340 [Sphingobium quisquiliarum P25]|uniref:TonB-denpendent receptor n=2 Tax=Sphingobium quisquiliarum TaxID=538379 RepID=T0GIA4_9SPHN|nr:hypothetical protein L288_18340 [Sphingobium quisquiliarum P25]
MASASGAEPSATLKTGGPVADATGPTDIIVTAQRRSERLVDVPAAIATQTGDELQSAGVTRFQDLGLVAPSVQISRFGTYTQPAIRGVSTTFAGVGQEVNVAVYVDGFYTSDQLSVNQDLINIKDVQILKGPQGTLYGRNATGGAILINTLTPGEKFEARMDASYAPRFDDKSFAGYVAGPLGEGISLGVAANYRATDGYMQDINKFAPDAPIRFVSQAIRGTRHAAPFKNYAIRPKLVLEPSDDVTVTIGYVHSFINDPRGLAFQSVDNVANAGPAYFGYPVAIARDRTSLNFQPVAKVKADEGNLTAAFDLGSLGVLTSRSAYRRQHDYQMYDIDAAPIDPVSNPFGTSYADIERDKRSTFTQQLDLATTVSPDFELLAGLFYYRDNFQAKGLEDIGLSFSPTTSTTHFRTRSWAAYLDGTYQIMPGLFFTAGGRYSEDRKRIEVSRLDNQGRIIASQSTIGYYADGVGRVENHAFTPRANLRYSITDRSNVYASISKGFKSATINSFAPFNKLKPEKVTAYEVGYKVADRGFRGELSAFYYDFKNNQISALQADGASVATVIQNSGGAHIYGLEALVEAPVTGRLALRASAAYLHARYSDFENATNVVVDPTTNLNASLVGSWTGRRIARAPDWTATVAADYRFPLAGGSALLTATGNYSSRYAPQDSSYACDVVVIGGALSCAPGTNSKTARGRFEEDGYFLLNTQAAWTDPSKRWTVTIFGNNLTGTRYKLSNQGFFYATLQTLNEPRSIGGRLSFRY